MSLNTRYDGRCALEANIRHTPLTVLGITCCLPSVITVMNFTHPYTERTPDSSNGNNVNYVDFSINILRIVSAQSLANSIRLPWA